MEMAVTVVNCHCGGTSHKVIRPITSALPLDGSFPGAIDKWVKNREIRMAKEKKAEEAHGDQRVPSVHR
jgi:hypothetical protein